MAILWRLQSGSEECPQHIAMPLCPLTWYVTECITGAVPLLGPVMLVIIVLIVWYQYSVMTIEQSTAAWAVGVHWSRLSQITFRLLVVEYDEPAQYSVWRCSWLAILLFWQCQWEGWRDH